MELYLNKSQNKISRQTYSFLDWLGDLGGLLEALLIIGHLFVGPVASYALNRKLVTSMVR